MKRKPVDPMPINVSFSPKILPHGEIARMTLSQNDQQIQLTFDQAQSLATTITTRLQGFK